MSKRIALPWHLVAVLAFLGSAMAQRHYSIGSSELTPPSEWRQVKRKEDKLVFQSPNQRQQATITVMHFGDDRTFEWFTTFCQHRIELEKRELGDGFIEPDAPKPFKAENSFGLFYSGGDKKNGRVFSGYLSLRRRELLTIYVEGIGIDPKDHLASFKKFVTGLKRN